MFREAKERLGARRSKWREVPGGVVTLVGLEILRGWANLAAASVGVRQRRSSLLCLAGF